MFILRKLQHTLLQKAESFDLEGVTSNLVEETPLLKKKTKESKAFDLEEWHH
jgi:hypothetical protein